MGRDRTNKSTTPRTIPLVHTGQLSLAFMAFSVGQGLRGVKLAFQVILPAGRRAQDSFDDHGEQTHFMPIPTGRRSLAYRRNALWR